MRYSLLEAVQLILSSMDSDEVNSISDTVESNQVALILKSVYYDIATDVGLTEHDTLVELNASLDPTKPVLMTVPTNVVNISSIRYDVREDGDEYADYRYLIYRPFDEFYQYQTNLRVEDNSVAEMSITLHGEDFPFMYMTDRNPQYYTSIGENWVIFDAIDTSVDLTLQKSKTLCTATIYPPFTLEDNFVPQLDPTQFSYWINKAKTRAFNELKQQINQESAAEARRQKVIVQKRQDRTPDQPAIYKTLTRYGRK